MIRTAGKQGGSPQLLVGQGHQLWPGLLYTLAIFLYIGRSRSDRGNDRLRWPDRALIRGCYLHLTILLAV